MSVNEYLKELGSKLVLSSSEKESIETSIDVLKSRLFSYFGSDIKVIKVYGSYARGTILPRKVDDSSDVDVMIVFDNPYEYKPQTFLNKLKDFAEHYYSRSEIYQSSPTIVLELNHIKFELTPAYMRYGSYFIPKTPSEWMLTDPDGFYSKLKECNQSNEYKVKPIIRLLKYWNITKNGRDLESYELEKKIADDLRYAFYTCTSYTDYLKCALSQLKFSTDYYRVIKALDCITEALRLEKEGKYYSAEIEIKKAFPEV